MVLIFNSVGKKFYSEQFPAVLLKAQQYFKAKKGRKGCGNKSFDRLDFCVLVVNLPIDRAIG